MIESFNDALIECVKAAGGSKQVGAILWPEKAPDAAQRSLLDCLNDDRPAHLRPDQVLLVLRLARQKGCHIGMAHLCEALGYAEPQPVAPRDEADELRRRVLEMGRVLQDSISRLEQLERIQPVSIRSAA